MSAATKVHVLVFPYPSQGHMIPLLDLTHHLATRGVSVTILVTPKNLHILDPVLSKQYPSSIKTLVLPLPPQPSIPSGLENVKDLPIQGFISMMVALRGLHRPIVDWFRSHPDPPAAIISDFFLGWTHHLAEELGIQRINFSPSGAFALSVINGLWRKMPQKDDPNDESQVVSFPEIPNCPEYPWWQLSTVYRSYVAGDEVSEFIKQGFLGNMESWGLVVNSFTELERVYLEFLMKDLGHDRVWAIRPLLPPDNDDPSATVQRGGSCKVSVEEINSWLDAREDRTVVYVCFGSQAVLTNHQVRELAFGLEKSGVHFMLCLKEPSSGAHVDGEDCILPEELEDRVAERGFLIRGWVPQVVILKHRAVGAFLTHCGWNSVLEGVVAGVTLLCWPMGADQFSNATLLVEQWKVGIRVSQGARTVPDANVLARVVADSVSEKEVVEIRERMKVLRKAALESVKEGGSSVKELDGLINHLATLLQPGLSDNLRSK